MTPSRASLIVFDFDGVVADSEIVANAVLAEVMTECGVAMTTDESISAFMGKRIVDVIATIEQMTGRAAPANLREDYHARTLRRFRDELREIAGVRAYLDAFAGVKRCIASSSSPDRLKLCLDLLKLDDRFYPHVYSAQLVERGKPHPDIFLHVAREMGVDPADSLVIEDSESGVRGAAAAGMTVIGLLAGAHVRDGHGDRLLAAGARHVARDYGEARAITEDWLRRA